MKGLFFKGLATTMLIAATVLNLSAQPQRGGGTRPQRGTDSVKVERERPEQMSADEVAKMMTEKMTESLELTAAQVKKVSAANLDMVTKMMASKESPEAYQQAVVEILTPAQIVEYMKGSTQRRGGGQRPQMSREQGGQSPRMMPQRGGQEQGGQRNERNERPASPTKPEAKSIEEMAKMMSDKMVESLKLSDEQATKLYALNLDQLTKRKEAKELPTKYQETIVAILKPAQIVEFMKSTPNMGPQRGGQRGGKMGGPRGDSKVGTPKSPQGGDNKPQGAPQRGGRGAMTERPATAVAAE